MSLFDSEPETHPSYGLLQISRISGATSSLFGSPIQHQSTIRLRIARAHRRRDLHHDWYGEDDQLIEIEMSAAQFAEAITSLNMGVGTPCTLRRLNYEEIPSPPTDSPRKLIEDEFGRKIQELAVGFQQSVREAVVLLTDPAKKSLTRADRDALVRMLSHAEMELTANLPFVGRCFNETTERIVSAAKFEIDAFITMAALATGMRELTTSGLVPALMETTVTADGDQAILNGNQTGSGNSLPETT